MLETTDEPIKALFYLLLNGCVNNLACERVVKKQSRLMRWCPLVLLPESVGAVGGEAVPSEKIPGDPMSIRPSAVPVCPVRMAPLEVAAS